MLKIRTQNRLRRQNRRDDHKAVVAAVVSAVRGRTLFTFVLRLRRRRALVFLPHTNIRVVDLENAQMGFAFVVASVVVNFIDDVLALVGHGPRDSRRRHRRRRFL